MVSLLFLLLLQSQQLFQIEEKPFIPSSDSLITTSWMVEDGLPVNTVNEIYQDSTGFIWFTTYDGIVRFDGLNFKTFTSANTPGMPQNRAVFMQPQSGKKLWISLEHGGVLLKDGEKFRHFGSEQGFVDSNVIYMCKDSNGGIWFATFDGAFQYRDGSFRKVESPGDVLDGQVNHVYKDIDGTLWFAANKGLVSIKDDSLDFYQVSSPHLDGHLRQTLRTSENELLVTGRTGVYSFENGQLVQPERFRFLKDEYIYLINTSNEKTYFATSNGIYSYKDKTLDQLPGNENPGSGFISFIEDKDGSLWLTNTSGEVYILRNESLSRFRIPEVTDTFHVNRVMKDHEENLWLATARNGLVRIKTNPIRSITTQNGLSGNNILGLFEDRDGTFWVGTRDFGLNKIENNTITTYQEPNTLLKNIVHTISQDYEGNIWVGYYNGGLIRINKQTGNTTAYSTGNTEKLNDVRSVFVKSDSTLWVGTYGGLIRFDPEQKNHRTYTIDDGLSDDMIRYIAEDNEGGLWIGTLHGGVNYFKEGEFSSYTEQDGLASNNVRSVYVDEFDNGTVWVGTETNGISRIKNGQIQSLGTEDGLPDHVIHYISQDSLEYLWMSSNRGIIKIEKNSLNRYLDGESDFFNIVHYNRSDGMLNPEANGSFQQGGMRTSNGEFWFSTQEGVAIFPIHPPRKNEIKPTLLVSEITAAGNTFELTIGEKTELNKGVKGFSINFHALTFTSPEKTRFRYRLLGHQDEWQEVYNERTVTFSDLRAGEYTFQLLAANDQGIWNTIPAEATILITDYFYNQWWFFPLVVVLIFLSYIPVSKLRYRYLLRKQKRMQQVINRQTAQIRNEKEELEKRNKIIEEQSERLQELNKTKDKFFSIIAHDLRNPFQAILGFTEILKEDAEKIGNEDFIESVEQIDIAGKRVFELLENLLEWSSLQTGKIKSNPENLKISDILLHTQKLMEHQAYQKNITISLESGEDLSVYADANMLRTVLRNVVSNAIKFTKAGGIIKITAVEQPDDICISVEDNGIGMSEQMLRKLMKLDSNISRPGTGQEQGSGLGLIISNEMVTIQNGTLMVDSEKEKGTTFKIFLPKGKQSSVSYKIDSL